MSNNVGRITLLKNNSTNPAHPEFRGFITIGDTEYQFAVWPAKSGKEGSYSGQIQPKEKRQQQGYVQQPIQSKPVEPFPVNDLDDEIPFVIILPILSCFLSFWNMMA